MHFKYRALTFVFVILTCTALAEDNTLLVVDGVNTNVNNDRIYVGETGTNNWLKIINGGVLTHESPSRSYFSVGTWPSASNNHVLVSGDSSRFTVAGDDSQVLIGDEGRDNILTVEDGGTAWLAGDLILGNRESANGNQAVVSGTGSSMRVDQAVRVGWYGAEALFRISNGAQFDGNSVWVGLDSALVVRDSGTRITGDYMLTGNGSSARISDGAQLTAAAVSLGSQSSTRDIACVVEGAGTRLLATNKLSTIGIDTLLTITNGAYAEINQMEVGRNGMNNRCVISGPDTRLNCSESLIIGYYGGSNHSVVLTNGAQAVTARILVGNQSSVSDAELVLSGAGTSLRATNSFSSVSDYGLTVGERASGSRLRIEDGAELVFAPHNSEGYNSTLCVGNISTASDAYLHVTGAGSRLTAAGAFIIGNDASHARFLAENGATIQTKEARVGSCVRQVL